MFMQEKAAKIKLNKFHENRNSAEAEKSMIVNNISHTIPEQGVRVQ